jgi:hypothetical protein
MDTQFAVYYEHEILGHIIIFPLHLSGNIRKEETSERNHLRRTV